MTAADFRIESNQPIGGSLWPAQGAQRLDVSNLSLAIMLAAKSFTPGSEIRVVHVPTGEVLFRKAPARAAAESSDEF